MATLVYSTYIQPRPRSSEVYQQYTSSDLGLGLYICGIHLVAMVYILHIYVYIVFVNIILRIVVWNTLNVRCINSLLFRRTLFFSLTFSS